MASRHTRTGPEAGFEHGGRGIGNAGDDREVVFLHRPFLELLLQEKVRGGILRDQETSRRVTVEAVDQDGVRGERQLLFLKNMRDAVEDRLLIGSHARARMHGDARGLVDDQARVVLEEDFQFQINGFDVRRNGFLLFVFHFHLVSLLQAEGGFRDDRVVHAHEFALDDVLRLGAA